jgi:hypothetical protein
VRIHLGGKADLDAGADAQVSGRFGYSAAVSGDNLVVGAGYPGGTDARAAYVFQRTGADTAWQQSAKLVADVPEADAEFGSSVAISGRNVVVGAGNAGDGAGACYAF